MYDMWLIFSSVKTDKICSVNMGFSYVAADAVLCSNGLFIAPRSSLLHTSHACSSSFFCSRSLSRSDPRSFPEPGRNSAPGRGYAWPWPGSGPWIIWRLAQRLYLIANWTKLWKPKQIGQSTEYSLTFASEQQSLTKHWPPLTRDIELGTVIEEVINGLHCT